MGIANLRSRDFGSKLCDGESALIEFDAHGLRIRAFRRSSFEEIARSTAEVHDLLAGFYI